MEMDGGWMKDGLTTHLGIIVLYQMQINHNKWANDYARQLVKFLESAQAFS